MTQSAYMCMFLLATSHAFPQSRTLEHYSGIFLGVYGSSCWWKELTYMKWQVYNNKPSLCSGNSKYVHQYCRPNCHRGLSISTLINYFPSSLPHVNPTLVEALLDPMWKLQPNTSKDEIKRPLRYAKCTLFPCALHIMQVHMPQREGLTWVNTYHAFIFAAYSILH